MRPSYLIISCNGDKIGYSFLWQPFKTFVQFQQEHPLKRTFQFKIALQQFCIDIRIVGKIAQGKTLMWDHSREDQSNRKTHYIDTSKLAIVQDTEIKLTG